MDMDSDLKAVNEEQSQARETDSASCKLNISEIASLSRDSDDSCSTECVSGDWSAEDNEENLAVVKQEPDDVRSVWYFVLYSLYHNRRNMYRPVQ